ncbi:Asp-tRNA(Asn)/Glu-tRNA(Gln) amidotransferase GatCAB subunit C [Candidatus Kuenenbacteria bacterium HGW-Kuenenbacteria-1]|uniref:Aspartyl/glutamyl-tRNA(Asn/Gln) amidotransferase subunit C n=1 Tax=Candidatus Kuenenbacteria bacterium HGW-Kuenenbacteria-1 TaxID=2013812 RepID=A0A2N1UN98_9BACT|nr:MAG: Asp-tRNA(Asn)/Glu-tRNA(Gln) amidotransferase GatCAB subunit C [Candidatus Kuenenbacteria bacterium HGW-Kuenenbacteria-1]
MNLTIQEVEHIAKLARLKLTDQEKKKFAQQLSSVLDYAKQLDEVDTENVKPTNQIIGLKNIYRQDEINEKEKSEKQALLQCAPNTEDGYIKIPSVF